jgi:hypothetical protein
VLRKTAQRIENGQSIQQGEVDQPWVLPYDLLVKIEEQTLVRWFVRLPDQPDLDEVPTCGIVVGEA